MEEISEKFRNARKTLRDTENRIKTLNEQIHYISQYQARKSIQAQFLKSRNKKNSHQEHRSELDLYNAGVKYIKEHFDGKVPLLKSLKAERDQLIQMKEAQYGTYQYFQKELRTVSFKVDTILGKERNRTPAKKKRRTSRNERLRLLYALLADSFFVASMTTNSGTLISSSTFLS